MKSVTFWKFLLPGKFCKLKNLNLESFSFKLKTRSLRPDPRPSRLYLKGLESRPGKFKI